jgi:hypothetical protein
LTVAVVVDVVARFDPAVGRTAIGFTAIAVGFLDITVEVEKAVFAHVDAVALLARVRDRSLRRPTSLIAAPAVVRIRRCVDASIRAQLLARRAGLSIKSVLGGRVRVAGIPIGLVGGIVLGVRVALSRRVAGLGGI